MLTISAPDYIEPDYDPDSIRAMADPLIEGSVELVLVDSGYIRVLNRRYRHLDRPTDVLTFDLSIEAGPTVDQPGRSGPDGVIYINQRACETLEGLLERLFHGYLHLLGRSHDSPEDSLEMERDVRRMVARCTGGGTEDGP